jgi:CheY-like chemotaxis protein
VPFPASVGLIMRKVALVVDDSMLIRYTLSRFLEERGYTVETATNGKEALEVVNRVCPDVVVTDMQMRLMSGSELITALKSKPDTAKVPIIIVASKSSGFTQSETRADFTICKDIDIDAQLGKALDALMGDRGRSQAAGK